MSKQARTIARAAIRELTEFLGRNPDMGGIAQIDLKTIVRSIQKMDRALGPDREGWYPWRKDPTLPWDCVFVHDPTGDGMEVYQRGPISNFPDAEWGARIPMPDEATDGDL